MQEIIVSKNQTKREDKLRLEKSKVYDNYQFLLIDRQTKTYMRYFSNSVQNLWTSTPKKACFDKQDLEMRLFFQQQDELLYKNRLNHLYQIQSLQSYSIVRISYKN